MTAVDMITKLCEANEELSTVQYSQKQTSDTYTLFEELMENECCEDKYQAQHIAAAAMFAPYGIVAAAEGYLVTWRPAPISKHDESYLTILRV